MLWVEKVEQFQRTSRAQEGYVVKPVWYVRSGLKKVAGPFPTKKKAKAWLESTK